MIMGPFFILSIYLIDLSLLSSFLSRSQVPEFEPWMAAGPKGGGGDGGLEPDFRPLLEVR